MTGQTRFDAAEFLRELSLSRDNRKRCDLVAEQVDSLIETYGLSQLIEVKKEKLNSVMVQKGLYNIEVAVPDLRRLQPDEDGESAKEAGDADLEELIMSCHTDAIMMSLTHPVGPGVNDNGSGVAVLLTDMDKCLRSLSADYGLTEQDKIINAESLPKTRYLFFTGEEGSLRAVGISTAAFALSYAIPGTIIGQLILPGAGIAVPMVCSLMMMEKMSRSPMFNSGLCGSHRWVSKLPKDEIEKKRRLVNFDMVGQYSPSVEGGWEGIISETKMSLPRILGGKSRPGKDETRERVAGLKSVVVPSSNISTNPASWVSPVQHDGLSPYLGEVIYLTSVETGRMYNVRDFLSLGSSDHAIAQQVSDRRNGGLESAMMIGLGGMAREHEIHTRNDDHVEEGDLEFSCLVAERLGRTSIRGWKSHSQVRHLREVAYAGLYGNGADRILVARLLDDKRDQWVNVYFGLRKEPGAADEAIEEIISLDDSDFIDWNIGTDIARRGVLKGQEGYDEIPCDGKVVEYLGRKYRLEEASGLQRRMSAIKADTAEFLADRQMLPMIALMVPTTSAIIAGGGAIAASIPVLPIQAGVLVASIGASVYASYKLAKLPLKYSNVVAETMYDLASERANSQLHKAVLI